MLSAGFFTTQKSQEVVHTGVTQASSSVAPSGDMIVGGAAGNTAGTITFYITNTAGSTAVDITKTVITYTDNDNLVSKGYAAANANGWTYTGIIHNDGAAADNLIESGEKYRIDITLAAASFGAGANPAFTPPGINEQIKIEVKPPEGAVLVLQKTMPPALVANNYYPVY
jgi:flagellin FlaB